VITTFTSAPAPD